MAVTTRHGPPFMAINGCSLASQVPQGRRASADHGEKEDHDAPVRASGIVECPRCGEERQATKQEDEAHATTPVVKGPGEALFGPQGDCARDPERQPSQDEITGSQEDDEDQQDDDIAEVLHAGRLRPVLEPRHEWISATDIGAREQAR